MALKHSYFFRPASRPSSPAPQSLPPSAAASPLMTPTDRTSPERVPRSLNKLGFTTFRRATPTPAATPPPAVQPTLTQDGSYLEALSLKLSEAVSKALAQPAGSAPAPGELLAGRRPIPAGRGTQFGVLVAAELKAASGNANLRRAIVRSLQRPLSVLLTNVSSKLLPLLSSPAFLDPSAPTAAAPSPNPTQLHALAYANFCGEVVDALNEMGLGQESDMRGDGLRGVREDLASMVGRVVNPLLNGIKKEILPLIDALEQPTPSPQPAAVVAKGIKVNPATPPHPSVLSLQTVAPVYAKALARYCQTLTAQALLAPFLISIVWRALVALAYRPTSAPVHAASTLSQPPTPRIQPLGLKKPRTSSSTTPPTTPPAMRFGLKLPPSRPPTPPGGHGVPPSNTATDARALFDLLSTFPRPSAEHTPTRLAREAVDEAFDALRALATLLDAVHAPAADLAAELEQIGDDLPVLIALQVLLPTAVYDGHHGDGRSVHQIVGMSEAEYRAGCLAGFGRAEEYAPLVGKRVIDALAPLVGNGEEPANPVDSPLRPSAQTVLEWLEDAIEED